MEPILLSWNEKQTLAKSKITSKVSLRILERYPIDVNRVKTLFQPEELAGGDPDAIFELVRQLLNAWKFLLYFQPKPDAVIETFRSNNYPDAVIKGLLEAYRSSTFSSLLETLAATSHSGIPRVTCTDWTSTSVLERNGVTSSDREVVLTLSTDQGVKKVELDGRDLERLYWTVNQVQSSLDSLLER